MSKLGDFEGEEFLFAKINIDVEKRATSPAGFWLTEYDEYELDDELQSRSQASLQEQFVETARVLNKKTIKEENEVFYTIYTKAKISDREVKDLLGRLNATIVAYLDRKRNGILLSASAEKLTKLTENHYKYLDRIRIIKPLTTDETIDDSLKKNNHEIQMAFLTIIPNLDLNKISNYMNKLTNFLEQNQCKMYGQELQKYGFLLADVTLTLVKDLVEKATFIFNIVKVPDAIAQSIRSSSQSASPENDGTEVYSIVNPFLPNVVLMDSGVNNVESLQGILEKRDAYVFQNLNDEHDDPGHGTPIANLIAFGESGREAVANIISYKIWASNNRGYAYHGLLNGIEKYSGQSRLFVTSIGIPFGKLDKIVTLDRLVQSKNICLVSSAGNIDLPILRDMLKGGAQYPDYLKSFPVMSPANGVNVVAVGSIAKRVSTTYSSIAQVDKISPHSCCGPGALDLYECKKPEVVEHGGNVNVNALPNLGSAGIILNTDGVGVTSIDRYGNRRDDFSGSSFSSPLFIRRVAQIERRYHDKITNVETLLSILYLNCKRNLDSCGGYGEPITVTGCDENSAIYIAEGSIGFSSLVDDIITTPFNDITIYVPSGVDEITLCMVHSDDFKKAVIPTLETYLEIKAKKMGNNQPIIPLVKNDINKKTNVKILSYKFDAKSMESLWTFRVKPHLINNLLSDDKKSITVRYGCAILLKGKSSRESKKSITQEIIEYRRNYL